MCMVQENATMITEADFIVRRIWTLPKNGQYQKIRKEPRKPGDIYMSQILDEEMKADDSRIR